MKTISLKIKPEDASRYGLEEISSLKFDELVSKITADFTKEALLKAQSIAEKTGLSKMTLEEIDQEIKAVRDENHP
jgi:hypothetical protein